MVSNPTQSKKVQPLSGETDENGLGDEEESLDLQEILKRVLATLQEQRQKFITRNDL